MSTPRRFANSSPNGAPLLGLGLGLGLGVLAGLGWAPTAAALGPSPAGDHVEDADLATHQPAAFTAGRAAPGKAGGAARGKGGGKGGKGGGKQPAKGGGDKPKKGGKGGGEHGARAFDDTLLVRPVRAAWPAFDVSWQHRLAESVALEASFTAGRYRPLLLRALSATLEERGFTQPIGLLSGELGASWHPNHRFHKGFRLGLSLKVLHMSTETRLSNDDGTVETDVGLNALAPLIWGGYKRAWKSGFTLDYRLGAGPMVAKGSAQAQATATADGQTVATAGQQFESTFPAAWVTAALGVGWSF
jgi:hypothetical protein